VQHIDNIQLPHKDQIQISDNLGKMKKRQKLHIGDRSDKALEDFDKLLAEVRVRACEFVETAAIRVTKIFSWNNISLTTTAGASL
jgi:hypothetical protein